jgi:DNA-binding MarR family transcriptional regulator
VSDQVREVVIDWQRERPDLDTAPMEVVTRILRAGHLLQKRLDKVAAGYGLSHKGDLDALAALRRSGKPYELTPTQLAQWLQLTSGGMTNRLDRLEELALVARRPDPNDRRGTLVGLTNAGIQLVDDAFASSLRTQSAALDEISKRDKAELGRILEQLLVSLGDTPVPTA